MTNDLSASFFTFRDEYWTVFYVKPYARLPSFFVGMFFGFMHYSQRYEHPDESRLSRWALQMAHSTKLVLALNILGVALMILMITAEQAINNAPERVNGFVEALYLMFSRPTFVTGIALQVYPMLMKDIGMNKVLDNEFWVPFSRLSYGAFLVHGVFMLFREYNNERGQWGELFDATLFFLAYAFLSFLFSFLTYVTIEAPFG